MRDSNLIADASCHFTDDLYPLKQRALQQFADIEAGPIVLDVAPAPIDRSQRPPDAHGRL
jgi:hypothetical protein